MLLLVRTRIFTVKSLQQVLDRETSIISMIDVTEPSSFLPLPQFFVDICIAHERHSRWVEELKLMFC